MIIRDKKRYNRRWRMLGASIYQKVSTRRLFLSLFLLIALVVYTGVTVGVGMMLHKSGAVGGVVVPMLQTRLAVIPNYLSGQLFGKPEKLVIDIKHVDYQKLAYKREQALDQQFLIAESDDYVPAQIRYRGEKIPAKLRLKGDMIDHLRWDKWSFRVQVKGEHTLLGMRVFSLQHPKTRNYIYEWLYHKALAREGLIALRYDFVDVVINGEPKGIYAVEEHFSKELIENNRYREAPIVRFNEDLYWAQSLYLIDFPGRLAAENAGHFMASMIEPFQTSKTVSDPQLRDEFEYAAALLEAFRRGELATHELFDVRKLANYLAVIEVMGTSEWTLDWTDQRFYYNPITAKLEPIGFDGHIGFDNYELMGQSVLTSLTEDPAHPISELPTRIFHDPVFYREYVQALERVSAPDYLDSLLSGVSDELRDKMRILHREYPYVQFSMGVFQRNQDFIRKMLRPVRGMHAYFEKYEETAGGQELMLKVGNIQGMPLEISSATYLEKQEEGKEVRGSGGQGFRRSGDFLISNLQSPISNSIIPARGEDMPVEYASVRLQIPAELQWNDTMLEGVRLHYRVLGANGEQTVEVYPWRYLDTQTVRQDILRHPAALDEFPFLQIQDSDIIVQPGQWNLSKPLIIPAGHTLYLSGDTEIDLTNGGMILSYSRVVLNGTEESPVVIRSSDGTGQGIAIIQAPGTSIFRYARFENLSYPSLPGWELSGSVTFYESKVQIAHAQFLEPRSEDGLNIVRSEFEVVDSLFHGTASDAFDVDFGNGRVERTRFVACGNDGFDISGTVAQVRDCVFDGTGDKGISIGEASQAEISGVSIRGAHIAMASKDRSQIIAEHVRINDSEIGLTAFQKKPEFGPATIQVNDLDIQNTQEPYLVEVHSSASVNGTMIVGKAKHVADRFYGATAQANQRDTLQVTDSGLSTHDPQPVNAQPTKPQPDAHNF